MLNAIRNLILAPNAAKMCLLMVIQRDNRRKATAIFLKTALSSVYQPRHHFRSKKINAALVRNQDLGEAAETRAPFKARRMWGCRVAREPSGPVVGGLGGFPESSRDEVVLARSAATWWRCSLFSK
jgi:hypothetical protein